MTGLPGKIDLIVFDFDGVFTDNKVIVNEYGQESVICDRADGLGISLLKQRGIGMMVLSTEQNPIVSRRCEKLGVLCTQGVTDKESFLSHWVLERNILFKNVVYVGNDVNDEECMQMVGCSVAPKDSRVTADIILEHSGGDGAVRELADMILRRKP